MIRLSARVLIGAAIAIVGIVILLQIAVSTAPAGAAQQTDQSGGRGAATDPPTLGPDGYKALQLGMSEKDAQATGLLVDPQRGQSCHTYYLRPSEGKPNPGGGVFVDRQHGVVAITGTTQIITPEGIHFGSTLEEVKIAYPDLQQDPDVGFVYTADVPGNQEAKYRFAVGDGVVKDYALEAADMGSCG